MTAKVTHCVEKGQGAISLCVWTTEGLNILKVYDHSTSKRDLVN